MDVTAPFLTLHLLIHTGQKALSPASDTLVRIKQEDEDKHSALLLFFMTVYEPEGKINVRNRLLFQEHERT